MARPVTLFTGQWADLPFEELCKKAKSFGYDGLELACWGDHFEVGKALTDSSYIPRKQETLAKHGLKCYAISNHLVGQAVCDNIDERHKGIVPPHVWGDGNPEGVRQRAAEEMKNTARAAAKFGVKVVNGFTGSSIWHLIYSFPPNSPAMIDAGYADFAKRWNPIIDVFDEVGVKFALEVHPTEIAYDIYTTQAALAAIGNRPGFGINFDPSHLYHQFIDSVAFIEAFKDRIYHVHVKESARNLNGHTSILGSHLNFGDARRGWDFISPGRGEQMQWGPIFRALTRIGYQGPLSVEWEDSGMDREYGATDACAFVRRNDFTPSNVAFDAAFSRD